MKKLYLIRHAKSLKDGITPDFVRPLTKRGKNDAKAMALKLKNLNHKPDLIISSSAKRTSKTAKIIARYLGYKGAIKYTKKLYSCEIDAYMNEICAIKDKYKSVFIVGHNDELSELCEYLSGLSLEPLPTCGIYALKFKLKKFSKIKPNSAKIMFFEHPKILKQS